MDIVLDGKGFLYDQIARSIKHAIVQGRLRAGTRLPSTRVLSRALNVSRKSVNEAYEILCAENLTIARSGSGTRVAEKTDPIARKHRSKAHSPSRFASRIRHLPPIELAGSTRSASRPKYNLQCGEPLIRAALSNSWRRKLSAAALRAVPHYQAAAGYLPLRVAIAEHLRRRSGVLCDHENILIVNGTQQALTLVSRVVLDEGDIAAVEDPSYEMAMQCLLAHGARVLSVETDDEGMQVAQLPQKSAKLAYVTPSHQFPSGVVMSLARRLELIKWAGLADSWIFEDNYDGEFHPLKAPCPPVWSLDVTERTFYVGSFSKTLFPSLRLGYVICPSGLRNDLIKAKLLDDMGSPTTPQAALATFIQSRQYEKHLQTTVHELIRRRDVLTAALQQLGPQVEIGPCQGGMHFVLWFRQLDFAQLEALIAKAKTVGLGIYPVHPYYKVKPIRPGLLIGYAGLTLVQLRAAALLLGRCLRAVQK